MGADRDRLTDVFQSPRQRLFCIALRLLGNVEDAEDAVQEGLLSAIRNLHRFEGRAQLSTWLATNCPERFPDAAARSACP